MILKAIINHIVIVGGGYIQPNVSLSIDTNNIHYNLNANGHDYVDLDLPSGTLWATCNVGANKPSDAGLYFQWGDTVGYTVDQVGKGEGKKNFFWLDYKWGIDPNFKKYTNLGEALELEDDAAHVNMGGNWHMPTNKQVWELINNTTSAWTASDGVSGVTLTSKNDTSKSIFFYAEGNAWNGSVNDSGSKGYVWASMLNQGYVGYGQCLSFYLGNVSFGGNGRCGGHSVRGVIG